MGGGSRQSGRLRPVPLHIGRHTRVVHCIRGLVCSPACFKPTLRVIPRWRVCTLIKSIVQL